MTMATMILPLLLAMALLLGMAADRPASANPQQFLTIRGYAHLRFAATGSTEVFVVAGVNGDIKTSSFGSILVVDDPFRATDAADSALVGRIKGHGVNTDINSTSNYLTLYLTFLIDYNNVTGSVIVEGTRVGADAVRTLAITGGTGDFALARGVATQIPGPQGTDASGAVVFANEWRLSLLKEPNGPDTKYLAYKLRSLVVQQSQWTGDGVSSVE